jgi:predicted O-methyltransferase YrrM
VTTATSSGFSDALAAARDVEGWMSDDQARRLWDRASEVPAGGRIAEIGSFRGRSAIVLARAAAEGVEVVAIDPHAGNDRGPQQIEGSADEGEADHRAFVANLERAGVTARVRHVRLPSASAHDAVRGQLDLVYVDGAHRYAPARDDIRDWGARVAPGGTLLIHDGFSSVGVTLATLRLLVFNRRFDYRGRSRSLIEYRRNDLPPRATARSALRQLAQLPWFARNVLLKLAIVTRLRRDAEWPY